MNIRRNRLRPDRVGYSVWTGTASQLGGGRRAGSRWYYPAHLHLGHALPYQGPLSVGRRRLRARRWRGWQQGRVRQRPYLRQVVTGNAGSIVRTVEAGISRRMASLTIP